jgi:hypothetical protein
MRDIDHNRLITEKSATSQKWFRVMHYPERIWKILHMALTAVWHGKKIRRTSGWHEQSKRRVLGRPWDSEIKKQKQRF